MNKKIPFGIALAFIIAAIAATYSVTMMIAMRNFNSLVSDLSERTDMYRSLTEIDQVVRQNFDGDIDEQLLSDSLSSGYINGLGDDNSRYMTQSQLALYQKELQGNGQGIGAKLMEYEHPDTGYIYVDKVYSGGPAEVSGLKEGDQIVSVDGEMVGTGNFDSLINKLNQTTGATLSLTVVRSGEETEINVACEENTIQTVFYKSVGSVGYIRITEFYANTASQFESAVESLQKSNVRSLIVDVRNNNSDNLEYAASVIDKIVPTGTIMSAVYADGTKEALYTSDANDISLPIMVLVNKNTASAAELFACDLKDFGKASLVGTKTYGSGVMFKLYTLSDNSAVKITVGKYLPYKSDNFDGVGIEPDYLVENEGEDTRYLPTLAMADDSQFQEAYSLLENV